MPTRTKLPPERETKIVRSIRIRLLHRFGIRLWRRNVGAVKRGDRYIRFASPGQADLWGVHKGVHWELEVKRPGGRPTPRQIEWLKEMTDLGCVAFFSDNANDAEIVAEAIVVKGGRVVWEDDDYWVELPACKKSCT